MVVGCALLNFFSSFYVLPRPILEVVWDVALNLFNLFFTIFISRSIAWTIRTEQCTVQLWEAPLSTIKEHSIASADQLCHRWKIFCVFNVRLYIPFTLSLYEYALRHFWIWNLGFFILATLPESIVDRSNIDNIFNLCYHQWRTEITDCYHHWLNNWILSLLSCRHAIKQNIQNQEYEAQSIYFFTLSMVSIWCQANLETQFSCSAKKEDDHWSEREP